MIRPPPKSTLFPYTTLFRSTRIKTAVVSALCDIASSDEIDQNRWTAALLIGELVRHISWDVMQYAYRHVRRDRKSTRLNSSHRTISYAVFCLKKKNKTKILF